MLFNFFSFNFSFNLLYLWTIFVNTFLNRSENVLCSRTVQKRRAYKKLLVNTQNSLWQNITLGGVKPHIIVMSHAAVLSITWHWMSLSQIQQHPWWCLCVCFVPLYIFYCMFLLKRYVSIKSAGDNVTEKMFAFISCNCFFSLLLLQDGVRKHRGNTGHVFRDCYHFPVPSHGYGRRVGVLKLPQLQWDWGREEHVLWGPDASVPKTW